MRRAKFSVAAVAAVMLIGCGAGDGASTGTGSLPLAKNSTLKKQPAPTTTTRPAVTVARATNGCFRDTEVVLIAVGTSDRYCFTMATSVGSVLIGGRRCTASETGLYVQGNPPTTASYCIATTSLGSFRAPSP